ncbi:MAG: sugar transferase [Aliishimia sp.]
MDIALVLATAPITLPIFCAIALKMYFSQSGPIFFRAKRVGQNGVPFVALKFRTMMPCAQNNGVSGGDKQARITPFAQRLRECRLDEIPQIYNILRGDMSLVGPRAPDPRYVKMYPELYAKVLRCRPGLTGLATLHMHRFEDRILKLCSSAEETETTYCRRCIPRKARLDLIYQDRVEYAGFIWFDLSLLARSIWAVMRK